MSNRPAFGGIPTPSTKPLTNLGGTAGSSAHVSCPHPRPTHNLAEAAGTTGTPNLSDQAFNGGSYVRVWNMATYAAGDSKDTYDCDKQILSFIEDQTVPSQNGSPEKRKKKEETDFY